MDGWDGGGGVFEEGGWGEVVGVWFCLKWYNGKYLGLVFFFKLNNMIGDGDS